MRIRRYLMIIILVQLICVVANMAWGAEVLKIRVKQYPPQYYQDRSGKWTGLDVELARTLVEAAGLIPEFVERPWSRALEEIERGALQIMMNLSITPERSEYLAWIGPERIAEIVLVVKEENKHLSIRTIDDLAIVAAQQKMKFGILQDAYYSEEFNTKLQDPQFARFFETITDGALNPKKLSAGRILGFFDDLDTMRYQIAHHPDFQGLTLHSFVLTAEPVYFGISKLGVTPEILSRLRKAYEQLEQDGTFDQIRSTIWE